jgi:F0F1-type ATP synthase membrane subunit b/b'
MHRTATAAAEAAGEPTDLREGAQQYGANLLAQAVGQRDARRRDVMQRLGQELVVAAVSAVDDVGGGQRQR